MVKLLIQVALGAGIWAFLAALDVHWAFRVVAMLLGVIAVHWFWERFVFAPFDYLGVMPFSPDDPLMETARTRARETFGEFLELFPHHKQDSMVRFRFETDIGEVEYVWGDLSEINSAAAKVYLRTFPIQHRGPLDRAMDVSRENIDDWQIELRDGSLRGGFTNQASFKVFEREQGYMHPKFKVHLARFRDPLIAEPSS